MSLIVGTAQRAENSCLSMVSGNKFDLGDLINSKERANYDKGNGTSDTLDEDGLEVYAIYNNGIPDKIIREHCSVCDVDFSDVFLYYSFFSWRNNRQY